jgi:hypothetical protein
VFRSSLRCRSVNVELIVSSCRIQLTSALKSSGLDSGTGTTKADSTVGTTDCVVGLAMGSSRGRG